MGPAVTLLLRGRHGLDVPHPVGLLGPRARRAGRPPLAGGQQELPLAVEEVLHQLRLPPHVRPDLRGGPGVGGHRRPDEVVVGGDHLRRAEAAAAVAARRVVPAERRRRRRQQRRERDARARTGRIAEEEESKLDSSKRDCVDLLQWISPKCGQGGGDPIGSSRRTNFKSENFSCS